jgi:hypothetical protein
MDIRFRSGGAIVLLLVNGCVISIFIQFLGHHFSFRIPRDQWWDAADVVLSRLLLGLFISPRYTFSFSHRLSRGWRPANRLNENASALYEFDDLLHRLPVLVTIRFFILKHWFQFDFTIVSTSENLSLLGVYGSHGASHKLSKSLSFDIAHTLFIGDIPLEWLLVSYYL